MKRPSNRVTKPEARSVTRYLFFKSQLAFLEILNSRRVWRWPGHFLAQSRFEAGMFGLEGMDVRCGC
jgi:hypothetical protein